MRLKLTLAEFGTLAVDEQEAWLAWEYQRQQAKRRAIDRIHTLAKGDDGKISAELVQTYALLTILGNE